MDRKARTAGLAVVTLAVSFAAVYKLLQSDHLHGPDAYCHLVNTVEYARCFEAGALWPRWMPDLSSGYGGPNPMFYAPLYFQIPGRLHQLGVPLVASLQFTIALAFALAFAGMYLWARESSPRSTALVAASAYLLAPYTLGEAYLRSALPELMGMGLIPWVMIFARRAARTGRARDWMSGGLVLGAIVMTHILSLLMYAGLVAGYMAALAIQWARPGRALVAAAGVFAIGAAFSAVYWMPMLGEMDQIRHVFERDWDRSWRDHFIGPAEWLGDRPDLGVRLVVLAPVQVGLAALAVVVALASWSRRRRWALGQLAFALVVLAHLWLTTRSSRALWEATLLPAIQFPWRYMAPVSVGLAALAPVALAPLRRHRRARWVVCGVSVLFLWLSAWDSFRTEPAELRLPTVESMRTTPTAADLHGMYMPLGALTPHEPGVERFEIVFGSGQLKVRHSGPELAELEVDAPAGALLEARLFHYEGWRARVNGVTVPIEREDRFGGMRIAVPPGRHVVELAFATTPLRSCGLAVTLLACVAIAFWPARPARGCALLAACALLAGLGVIAYRRLPHTPEAALRRAELFERAHRRDRALAVVEGAARRFQSSKDIEVRRAWLREHGVTARFSSARHPKLTRPMLVPDVHLHRDSAWNLPWAGPFTAEYHGFLGVPADGRYGLALESDDGAELAIDTAIVLADPAPHSIHRVEADVALTRGSHRLAVRYVNVNGGGYLALLWKPPGLPWNVIPSAALRPVE